MTVQEAMASGLRSSYATTRMTGRTSRAPRRVLGSPHQTAVRSWTLWGRSWGTRRSDRQPLERPRRTPSGRSRLRRSLTITSRSMPAFAPNGKREQAPPSPDVLSLSRCRHGRAARRARRVDRLEPVRPPSREGPLGALCAGRTRGRHRARDWRFALARIPRGGRRSNHSAGDPARVRHRHVREQFPADGVRRRRVVRSRSPVPRLPRAVPWPR